jgi:hypothetical protein
VSSTTGHGSTAGSGRPAGGRPSGGRSLGDGSGRPGSPGGDRASGVPAAGSGDRRPAGSATGRTAAGRISTPTARTTQAARSAPTARSSRTPAARTATAGRDWVTRDIDPGRRAPVNRDRPPWRPITLDASGHGGRAMSPSTRRMYQRRRRSMLLAFLLVSGIVLFVSQLTGPDDTGPEAAATAPTEPVLGATPSAAPALTTTTTTPTTAAARPAQPRKQTVVTTRAALQNNGFDYATDAGPVLGSAGTLRRFKVAVEQGTGQRASDFAAAIDRTLGDPRSWIASGQLRLQRVPRAAGAEFTIFLASAATSEHMCARGGLQTAGYTSCRLASQVIINVDRWEKAIPNYGAPLATYQAYAINHEVGHQLGHGHEACPGAGKLAPVMQQQTYGLKGCTANAWPYVDGNRYAGSAVS